MRFGRFWQNWVSSVHTGSETIGLFMGSNMYIGLLYACGFISLISKALRPEAKNLGRLRLFVPRSVKAMRCFAKHVSADLHLDRSINFISGLTF